MRSTARNVLRLLLEIPPPYDFQLSTARFRDFGSDGATVSTTAASIASSGGRRSGSRPHAVGSRSSRGARGVAHEVGRLLGLPFDLAAFRAWAAGEPVLGPIVEALAGFRPTLNPEPFEALVVAITTQQISLRAAAAIRGNFVRTYGVQHEVAWEFPTRERIKERGHGTSRRSASRARRPSTCSSSRTRISTSRRSHALDDDEVIAALTAVRGLGRWTADWFLARHLARPHAWPAGDLGVRKAVSTFYAAGSQLSIEEVRRMSERFAPFENLSAQFLLAGARMAG